VRTLSDAEDAKQKSNGRVEKLVKELKKDFEENMNNDLQVKAAFDSLYETVSKLVKFKEKQELSLMDSEKALATLKTIDYVFQVIF